MLASGILKLIAIAGFAGSVFLFSIASIYGYRLVAVAFVGSSLLYALASIIDLLGKIADAAAEIKNESRTTREYISRLTEAVTRK